MKVHIGKKIKERVEELRMRPADLAEKINTSKQNVYGIFKRQSIDTELLSKLSKALDFDFFNFYHSSKSQIANEPQNEIYKQSAILAQELKSVRGEINELREKFELLKGIVDLLKKKIIEFK